MDAERLAELFAGVGPLRVKRMFGGLGVWRDHRMFALVAGDAVFLKADSTLAARLEAEGSSPFTYRRRGRPIALSYWRMPDAALDDPEQAAELARAALRCAEAGAR